MKFLCEKCNEYMHYEDSKPEEGSMRITFACSGCGNRISLITNPGETQLVHSLGVSIGGRKTKAQPLELTRTTLRQKRKVEMEEPIWSGEASERIERIPSFARNMAKKAVEKFAKEKGYRKITPEVVEEAKKKMGI
ncbi:MAG: PCP reductase family protein [Candidatus Hydrothermarchaeaceae archaeon]